MMRLTMTSKTDHPVIIVRMMTHEHEKDTHQCVELYRGALR